MVSLARLLVPPACITQQACPAGLGLSVEIASGEGGDILCLADGEVDSAPEIACLMAKLGGED